MPRRPPHGPDYQPGPVSPHAPGRPPAPAYAPPAYQPPPAVVPAGVRWQDYLTQFVGLPPELVAQIENIFNGTPDAAQAAVIAVGVIRGSDWYKVKYRGIGEGIMRGILRDESDYNAYVNSVQQSYRRYYGRDAGAEEIEAFLKAGYSPDTVERKGAGKAYVDANRSDLQYYSGAFAEGQLSEEQLTAVGEQEAGLGTTLGASIQTKVAQAVKKAQRVFEGQLATPNLSLGSQGLYAPSLGKQNRDLAA